MEKEPLFYVTMTLGASGPLYYHYSDIDIDDLERRDDLTEDTIPNIVHFFVIDPKDGIRFTKAEAEEKLKEVTLPNAEYGIAPVTENK